MEQKKHINMYEASEISVENKINQEDFDKIIMMIKNSQIKAYSSVNRELIDLYYNLGKYISIKIEVSSWGKGIEKELAEYIEKTNPELKGFSDKNLWRMKQFYETYKDNEKGAVLEVMPNLWTENFSFLKTTP